MKRIPLRRLVDPQAPELDMVVWADIIRNVIRQPLDRQKGADIGEIRRGIRVLDALERCDGQVLELEDSDWEHLRDKTQSMPWGVVDRRILRFCEDILEATETLTLNDEVALASANGVAT